MSERTATASGRALGRPRSDDVTRRVRAAARATFTRCGFAAVTMAEIAGAAGVGLDSIYRRWPSKQALLLDVVASAIGEDVGVPDTGSLARDLEELLAGLVGAVQGDLGVLLAAAVAESARDPQLAAELAAAQARRRETTMPLVQRAVARGELPSPAAGDLLLDAVAGVVWQRLWFAGRPMAAQDVATVVNRLLSGFAAPH